MKLLFFCTCFIFLSTVALTQKDSLYVSDFLPTKYTVYPYKALLINDNLIKKEISKYPYIQDEKGSVIKNIDYVDSLSSRRLENFNSLYKYPLNEVNYTFFYNDVPVFIDSVLDGVYIQYYDRIPYKDKDTVKFYENKIATIFSIENNVAQGNAYWFTIDQQILYKKGFYENAFRKGKWWLKEILPNMKDVVQIERYYNNHDSILYHLEFYTSSGKHTIDFSDSKYNKSYYYDDILLLGQTDTTFEVYQWKIPPSHKNFKANVSNRQLIEKYKIGGALTINNFGLLNLKNLLVSEWENNFNQFRDSELTFFPHFKSDNFVYLSNLDVFKNNVCKYESYYFNGNPFVKYKKKNGKENLLVYDQENRLLKSVAQVKIEKVKRLTIHNSNIEKKGVFFIEKEFNTQGEEIGSYLYNFKIDTVISSDSSKSFYYNPVTKINLLYPDSILVDGNMFYLREYKIDEDTKPYIFSNFKETDSIKDTFQLIYATYNLKEKQLKRLVYANFLKKEYLFEIRKPNSSSIKLLVQYNNQKLRSNLFIYKNGLELITDLFTDTVIPSNLRYIDYFFLDDLENFFSMNLKNIHINLVEKSPFYFLHPFLNSSLIDDKIYYHYDFIPTLGFTLKYRNKPINGMLDYSLNTNSFRIKTKFNRVTYSFTDFYEFFKGTNEIFHNKKWGYYNFDDYNPTNKKDTVYFRVALKNGKYEGLGIIYKKNISLKERINKYNKRKYFGTCTYLNGKLEGEVFSKEVKSKTNYKLGLKDGLETCETIKNHKIQIDSINYKNGKLEGKSITYTFYSDTVIEKNIENYHQGYLDDKQIRITIRGSLIDTINYEQFKDGERNGNFFYNYNVESQIYYFENYKDGYKHGRFTIYNKKTNTPYFISDYEKGFLNGFAYYYYPNGKLYAKAKFDKGFLFDTIYFYDTLSEIKAIHLFGEDGFQGEIKYRNGKKVSSLMIKEIDFIDCDYATNLYNLNPPDINGFLYNYLYISNLFLSNYEGSIFSNLGFGDFDQLLYFKSDRCINTITFDYKVFSAIERTLENGILRLNYDYFNDEENFLESNYSTLEKEGEWEYNPTQGLPYTIDYNPTKLNLKINENESYSFDPKQKIIQYSDISRKEVLWEKYVIENSSLYNCELNETYQINTYYVTYEKDSSLHLRNGLQKNYYPNGKIQSEGMNKDGLPTGEWKFYNDNGSLREIGSFKYGKRNGRWLYGDLSKISYLGEICFDLENTESIALKKLLESQLEIGEVIYKDGEVLRSNRVNVKK